MIRLAEEARLAAMMPIPAPPPPDPRLIEFRRREQEEMQRLHKVSMERQKEIKTHDKETKRLNDEIEKMKSSDFEGKWRTFVATEGSKYDANQYKFLGHLNNSIDHKLAIAKKQAENAAANRAAAAKAEAEREAAEAKERERKAREYWEKKDAEALAAANAAADAAKPAAAVQFESEFCLDDDMY